MTISRLFAASVLASLLSAPVLAQPAAAPGAPVPRSITATGVTKPPSGGGVAPKGGAPFSKASTETDMLKAQRAAASRDKAWDSKMRTTMGSICQGC